MRCARWKFQNVDNNYCFMSYFGASTLQKIPKKIMTFYPHYFIYFCYFTSTLLTELSVTFLHSNHMYICYTVTMWV